MLPSNQLLGGLIFRLFRFEDSMRRRKMSIGLVLVDIQNDYFPGGKMELVAMESAARTRRIY